MKRSEFIRRAAGLVVGLSVARDVKLPLAKAVVVPEVGLSEGEVDTIYMALTTAQGEANYSSYARMPLSARDGWKSVTFPVSTEEVEITGWRLLDGNDETLFEYDTPQGDTPLRVFEGDYVTANLSGIELV